MGAALQLSAAYDGAINADINKNMVNILNPTSTWNGKEGKQDEYWKSPKKVDGEKGKKREEKMSCG